MFSILVSLAALPLQLLAETEPEMADNFRSEGKIYVVVTVISIIVVVLFAFLIYLDRKVSNLEKTKKQA